MTVRHALAVVSIAAAAAGCGVEGTGARPATQPSRAVYPPRTMPFAPTFEYRRWWQRIEQCSGLARSIDSVTFAVVGSPWMMALGASGPAFYRAVFVPPDSILVGLYTIDDSAAVMHEMMHALRPGRDGDADGGHPRSDFHGACAPLLAHGAEDADSARSPQ